MDESMNEGHERKEKGHAEKERKNDGFGAGDVFCNHLNKAPVHTSLGVVAHVVREREKYVVDPEEN